MSRGSTTAAGNRSANGLRGYLLFSRAAAVFAIVVSLSVLYGWQHRIGWLITVLPGGVAMAPNTCRAVVVYALSFVLLIDVPVTRWRSIVGRLGAAAAALVGALTLLNYVLGEALGVANPLVPEAIRRVGISDRISFNAALNLTALSLSLLLIDVRRGRGRGPTDLLAAFVICTSLAGLAGYAYGSRPIFGIPGRVPYTGLALNSASLFLLLSIAVLFARPDEGIAATITSPYEGGRMTRRLLLGSLLIPALGALALWGAKAELFDRQTAEALMAAMAVIVALALVLTTGRSLNAYSAENERLYIEAQRSIRTREEVLAIVSHDLKNPLNAVKLGAQLLQRQLASDDELPSPLRELLNRTVSQIHHSDERAIRLIADLLDFAKINAGTLRVEARTEDVRRILLEAVEMMSPAAEEKSISVRIASAEDVLAFCDRARVLQIIGNLVGNAIKFSAEGSTVHLSVQRAPEQMVHFAVRDEGPGMSSETAQHIFERYWQPRETARQGTGLGLAIAKGLVQAQGGRIWVDTEPGAGSTFSFTVREARPLRQE
ncbi:MAG: sensor histidine kinase, partial [Myxococcaceae bacterium]